jgi:hypothetical protein
MLPSLSKPDDGAGRLFVPASIAGDLVPVQRATITTYSGRRVDLLAPTADDVDFVDIAHALSMVCRFGGHCGRFLSVAEHCLLVSALLPPRLALVGLLHDAHEAYLGDVVTPLKRVLPGYVEIARRWDEAISEKFNVDLLADYPEVHDADAVALHVEAQSLYRDKNTLPRLPPELWRAFAPLLRGHGHEVQCLPPERAERRYIERCLRLVR